MSGYGTYGADMQSLQNYLNQFQAAGGENLVAGMGSQMNSAFQSANPQLQALQQQYTGLAQSSPSPISQINGAGSWAQPYAQQVGQSITGNNVNAQQIGAAQLGWSPQAVGAVSAGYNPTVNQLNRTAQQQLALGTSMSPQESSTVANQVMSNYNSMGRSNDPTAIAGLATGLDTYGQQLLTQRETNAANAGSLMAQQQTLGLAAGTQNQQANIALQGLGLQGATTQAGLTQGANLANQATNLSGQQSNLAALLQSLGLQGSALQAGGQQALSAGQSNQQAQMANAQYQQSLLSGAAGLAQSTGNPSLAYLLQQSGGLGSASNLFTQAGNTVTAGNQLSTMYNPFTSGAFNSVYGAQAGANTFNAQTNQGMLGSAMSLLGSNSAQNAMKGWGTSLSNLFNGPSTSMSTNTPYTGEGAGGGWYY
jgi:hypothetical protein